MIAAVRNRLTYSNVIGTMALFIALGGVAVAATHLPRNSVGTRQLKRGAVTSAKLAKKSVINGKLGPNSVGPGNIGNGAVTAAKLSDEIGPLIGTLKSGQTLRGSFDVGGESKVVRGSLSFQFPLTNAPSAPETNVLAADTTSAACPGLKGGNQQTPEAAAGQLCVYVKSTGGTSPVLTFDAGSVSRLGFGLKATFGTSDEANLVQGFWAVTAP
jgi:hypothetical protein